jgi:hypothetical protein
LSATSAPRRPVISGDVLTPRALNRALLQRQGLLARSDTPAIDMIEQLVGMQAQEPQNPYLALWSRLDGFDPAELSRLLAERHAVRAQLMRATIHLVSARDCLALHPITKPVLARTFTSPWGKGLAGADVREVAAAGLELLAERPRTRAELGALLAPRWPDADPKSLAHAVTFNTALVQVPPRGLWGETGQATWAPVETWLNRELHPNPTTDEVVLRYLAAFGPATVADIRTWSGLTGLREVIERLRPQLRTFRDEQDGELFDPPGAPLPDPDTPAPPRFLPEYDNLVLSHADRSRMFNALGPGGPFPQGRAIGALLVDGFYGANWKLTEGDGAATLTIDGFEPQPGDEADEVDEILAEGTGLLELLAPGASERRVEFFPRV